MGVSRKSERDKADEAEIPRSAKKHRNISDEKNENEISPWEQHATVVHLNRFNYDISDVLHQKKRGFIITCGFRELFSPFRHWLATIFNLLSFWISGREKSATNEALKAICEVMDNKILNLYIIFSKLSRLLKSWRVCPKKALQQREMI